MDRVTLGGPRWRKREAPSPWRWEEHMLVGKDGWASSVGSGRWCCVFGPGSLAQVASSHQSEGRSRALRIESTGCVLALLSGFVLMPCPPLGHPPYPAWRAHILSPRGGLDSSAWFSEGPAHVHRDHR